MPAFTVSVKTVLEIATTINVNAKDDDAAMAKVEKMIENGDFSIGWSDDQIPATKKGGEAEEADQTIDIDECVSA